MTCGGIHARHMKRQFAECVRSHTAKQVAGNCVQEQEKRPPVHRLRAKLRDFHRLLFELAQALLPGFVFDKGPDVFGERQMSFYPP